MPTLTSTVFDFLSDNSKFFIERTSFISPSFINLRKCLRQIVFSLYESQDWEAKEIGDNLRSKISEWLSEPVRFDDGIISALKELGNESCLASRWGADIKNHYDNSLNLTSNLIKEKNILRKTLSDTIKTLINTNKSFRIFCQNRSRKHFDTLSEEFNFDRMSDNLFIHSIKNYRDSELFDVLIKIGPLRSRGWSSAPDALITAPRFRTLIQMLWSGCKDEQGFGYDPVEQLHFGLSNFSNTTSTLNKQSPQYPNWSIVDKSVQDNSLNLEVNEPETNDFDVYSKLPKPTDVQRATLVQINNTQGLLYNPNSRLLCFDKNNLDPGFISLSDHLQEGMFIVFPNINYYSLAGLQASEGSFSSIWKDKLNEEFLRDESGLINRLQAGGLRLRHLRSRIEYWCMEPSTVIHAPQQMNHFEILINVLGIDFSSEEKPNFPKEKWWQLAWDEIRCARGEAIQVGFQEHQIIEEKILKALRNITLQIQENLNNESFQLTIPSSEGISGKFTFFRIMAIEEGFHAPSVELKKISELSRFDQWRA